MAVGQQRSGIINMSLFDSIFSVISGGKEGDATAAQVNAVNQLKNLQTPEIGDMMIELEELISQGVLTPEQAQTFLQENNAFDQMNLDPAMRNAQISALGQLQDISSGGGLTAMDKAKLAQIQNQIGSQERGSREAILQDAQSRGLGGSGLAFASQLANQQQSAQNASQQGMDVAAIAQQRALDAILQSGQLGGQIRGQDFNQQAERAQAQNMINQFNTQNKQNTLNQNVDRRNQAQQFNLGNAQSIADQNVSTRNQQQMFNKNLYQQDFENRYKKAGGTASAYQSQADLLNEQAKNRQAVIGGLIETGAKAAAGGG